MKTSSRRLCSLPLLLSLLIVLFVAPNVSKAFTSRMVAASEFDDVQTTKAMQSEALKPHRAETEVNDIKQHFVRVQFCSS